MYLKKIFSYLVVAAIMMSAATIISSCSKDGKDGKDGAKGEQGEEGPTNTFVVTFDYDNGTTVTQAVLGGEWAVQPPNPPTIAFPTEAGLYAGTLPSAFVEWLHDGAAFNFTTPITADITLTAHWTADFTPIGSVAANDLAAAVAHINANAGEYTLLIDDDVNAGRQTFDVANVKLTIIGIGGERTIQHNGLNNSELFIINAGTASLTLGQNITLRGIATGNFSLVYVGDGSLTMLAGSKITGHTTTNAVGAVCIHGANASFTMQGGEITGNHTSNNIFANATGGVYAINSTTFTMSGGSITGNTRKDVPDTEAMDVVLYDAETIANSSKTGGTIGVSIPAEFAGD